MTALLEYLDVYKIKFYLVNAFIAGFLELDYEVQSLPKDVIPKPG